MRISGHVCISQAVCVRVCVCMFVRVSVFAFDMCSTVHHCGFATLFLCSNRTSAIALDDGFAEDASEVTELLLEAFDA